MFKKILIANRGEIACRVIKTARRMGIATVAVYSEADRDARHVELADEAVLIGPPPSRESYLVMDRIIEACKRTGAEAVHPGYGFLSENEQFSRRIEEEGITFIGPKHYSIAAMGDKIASKKLALSAQVNTIPGWNDVIASPDQAVKIAKDIGYPVMIKASAGGGGKGLRVAWNDKDAFEGFASCRNEARASFGDDRVFIEKFVEQPRHIEIQVLGDAHGHCVYLWERECSIQRRHQKVIEEAPSSFISEKTRKAMGEQAVALAKAVKYQSAGTVEFVVGADQSFYFLEMNTRLQVEHPVTECITGLDLVEQMIRVAAGEKLGFTQKDIQRRGWAIECRINAEDPFRNFLPSTGRLVKFRPPEQTMEASRPMPENGGVRVDTGVTEGGEIPMYYDSMIAKLIVHGADRNEAIRRMREALNAFVIRGISSNIPFQAALLAHPKFVAGDFNTGFIAEQYPKGFSAAQVPHDNPDFVIALAATMKRRSQEGSASLTGQLRGHELVPRQDYVVVVHGEGGARTSHPCRLKVDDGFTVVTIRDRSHTIRLAGSLRDIAVHGEVDGTPFCAQVERIGVDYKISHNGLTVVARVVSPRAAALYELVPHKPPPDMSRYLLSPMPGLLVDVAVQPGQKVLAGEKLAVIEAMKMENVLVAAQDGVVAKIVSNKGESLAVDQVILEFEKA
ncbi:MAG TPA: acetyl/propionyl/methylcrotonyl-CoA carboxylase subunit alpha [Steroidobacteraceae bacterium]|nr:acetyl/propionyl/methylcrotonyl-CoA carboxylase subunit alpha [Steroidobacteraceae bacterium]